MNLLLKLVPFLALGVAGAQDKWPRDVVARIAGPCIADADSSGTGNRLVKAAGAVQVPYFQKWLAISIGVRVEVKGTSSTRRLNATVELKDLNPHASNPFVTGFADSGLGDGEDVISCEAYFVKGTRIGEKAAQTPARETLVCEGRL
jgi:hypothetical protein